MENWKTGLNKPVGTAYVVIEEENHVNELGNNIPSLVPYECSSEEDEPSDHSEQHSHDGTLYSDSPKSDSGVSKESNENSEDNISDRKVDWVAYFDRVYAKFDGNCSPPPSPELYMIWVNDEDCDDSYCIDLLKKYGCESCYVDRPHPGCFSAELHREQLRKVQGDGRICNIYPTSNICSC